MRFSWITIACVIAAISLGALGVSTGSLGIILLAFIFEAGLLIRRRRSKSKLVI